MPKEGYTLREELPLPSHLVDTCHLDMDLDPDLTRVKSTLQIRKNPEGPAGPLVLDAKSMTIESITVDGTVIPVPPIVDNKITIEGIPDACIVEITNTISPRDNPSSDGLYLSDGVLCTQCESHGFSKITPFPDEPNVLCQFSATLTANKAQYPTMLSNGNPQSDAYEDLGNGKHRITYADPTKKSSYLFCAVAGKLGYVEDNYTYADGHNVNIRLFVEPEDVGKLEAAMKLFKDSLAWNESIGLKYPLERLNAVGLRNYLHGAMENMGLITFNADYLATHPASTTDRKFGHTAACIRHELAHTWFGNTTTIPNWFFLFMKEGHATLHEMWETDVQDKCQDYRVDIVRKVKKAQFPEDQGSKAHPVLLDEYRAIENMYTSTTYYKGAELFRMFRRIIGDEHWAHAIVEGYYNQHKGGPANLDDFIADMSRVSGKDLSQMRHWFTQSGTPRLNISENWDPKTREYSLTIKQHCPPSSARPDEEKHTLMIPIAFALFDPATQQKYESDTSTYVMTDDEVVLSFTIPEGSPKPIPSLLRDFSAPVIIESAPLTPEEKIFLAAHDDDPYVRYDAVEGMVMKELIAMTKARMTGMPAVFNPAVLEALGKLIADPNVSPGLLAKCLLPCSAADVMNSIDIADPAAACDAVDAYKAALGKQYATELRDLYEGVRQTPPSLTNPHVGARSLKAACLSLLQAGEHPDASVLAQDQFEQMLGKNISDTCSAIKYMKGAAYHTALDRMYDVVKEHSGAVRAWFSLQASREDDPDIFDRLRKYALSVPTHPSLDMNKPNDVRAIFRYFFGNTRRFHDPSGEGYRLHADAIISLEKKGKSDIAGQLFEDFVDWEHLPCNLLLLMVKEWARIQAEVPRLSSCSQQFLDQAYSALAKSERGIQVLRQLQDETVTDMAKIRAGWQGVDSAERATLLRTMGQLQHYAHSVGSTLMAVDSPEPDTSDPLTHAKGFQAQHQMQRTKHTEAPSTADGKAKKRKTLQTVRT